jgi:hypothetical protein
MTWVERAQQVANWPGWRRHAPAAAGSIAVHLVALGLMAATFGAAAGSPAASAADEEEFLAIDLVQLPPEEIVPLEAGVTPPRIQPPRPATPDTAPVLPNTKRTQQAPGAPTTPGAAADEDSVYLPPSILKPSGPAGLAGLMGDERCSDPRPERRPRDCATDLAGRVGNMDSVLPRSKDDLAQHLADYMPTCPYRSGCEPGPRRTINGSMPAGRPAPGSRDDRGAGTPHAGGPAGLGGLHDSIGRLGFNPDHTDSGFGD